MNGHPVSAVRAGRRRRCAPIAAALALGACAGDGGPSDPLARSMEVGGAEAVRRLAGTENGLEVRKWIVPDDPSAFAATLGGRGSDAPLDADWQQRLRRNGLRLVRIELDELDAIAEALGGTTYDMTAWFGQALRWQDLMRRSLPPAGRAIAIDGHVRRYGRGSFRLALRAWSLQMEDGPYVHLELLPQYHPPEKRDLRDLLQDERPFEGERFETLALEMQLAGGYAYLLTAETPGVEWAPAATDGAEPVPRPATRRAMGPIDPVGPEVRTPPTIGELLLFGEGTGPPTRGIFVLIPKIGPELYPPGHPALARGRP